MSFRGAGGCSIVFLSGLAAMPLGGSFVLLFLIRSAMSCSIRRRRARRAVAPAGSFIPDARGRRRHCAMSIL